MDKISVIIPVFNEADNISKLVNYLCEISQGHDIEIIVIDGGSTDDTFEIANSCDAVAFKSPKKGRACQMNLGATRASGNILRFIHADTFPPSSCFSDVKAAINEGYDLGCFTYAFDSNHLLLKINGFFTRFDKMWCRGGDQTLFIKKEVFDAINGFREDYLIMEDYEILERTEGKYAFKIIKKNAKVSARKYEKNTYFRVQLANLKIFSMYRKGASQQEMADTYKKLLKK